MDSRRAPAVLLLIKTVVITFPILSEQGLGGAAAWHAENVSSRLIGGGSHLAPEGREDRHPLDAGGGPQGSVGPNRCVSVSVTTALTHTGKS